MNTIKAFFKDRGLYLLCLALVFGVTAGGIFGIRSAMRSLLGQQPQPGITQEDLTWDQPEALANNPVTDLPQEPSLPFAQPSAVPQPSAEPSQPTGGQGASAPSAPSSPQQPVSPVEGGRLGMTFSGDELVYHATLGDWRTHNGADYTAAAGAQVYAVTGGEVSAVYEDALFGTVVEVTDDHGGTWRYCGLAKADVARGKAVSAGQALGTLGTPPAEAGTGAHLHLEHLADGGYIDPAA